MDIKESILEKIKKADTIIIHRHRRPDGDAMGSSLGLRELLRNTYPLKKVLCASEDSSLYLSFLGSDDNVKEDDYNGALVIVLDTGTEDRISGAFYNKGSKIICIDHHESNSNFGDLNWVESDAASCADIITEFAYTFKEELKMSSQAALYLMTGIITDTGRFKYTAGASDAHAHASWLLSFNVDTETLFTNLYIEDKEAFALKKYVYKHYKITENGVAYIVFKKGSAKRLNTTVEELSACISHLDSIKGSMIWLLFNETGENIRIRLRSRYISLIDLASKYGGGGHANACGANIKSRKEIKSVLKDADALLKEFKENNKELF